MLEPDQLTIHQTSERFVLPFTHPAGQTAPSSASVAQLSATSDLDAIEHEWRDFERRADWTPFQTFDWLATWQRCIGAPAGVRPAIVIARRPSGTLLFLLPLAVERQGVSRRLAFLGRALCDYNAPLLAPEFSDQVSPAKFGALWASALLLLRQTAGCRHDVVFLDKMPELIGRQSNPMLALKTMPHPSGAYLTSLGAEWDNFYAEKRSSTTRQRDRSKRKKLTEHGDLRAISAGTANEIQSTLAVLFAQKSRSFAQMGVPDLFARPGHSEFFVSVASSGGSFVHVSHLAVGANYVAANLGLLFRGCYYHILASHDDGPLSRFGPGVTHLHELMSYAIAQGCKRFDFTIGDEAYKRDWADTKLDLYDHVSGIGWLGGLAAAIMIATLRAKRWIKNSPIGWIVAIRFRSIVGSIKQYA